MPFTLHHQLAADTVLVGDLPLTRVLLMNNRHFPWLILVPKRDGLRELFDLSETDYATCMQEVRDVAKAFGKMLGADKMNVAALGNMVPQLHIHIIARFVNDSAWPKPVWGAASETYAPQALAEILEKIRKVLVF